jgi:hypothetical protein
MPNADDIRWFDDTFASTIADAVAGTPLSVDLLIAVACQETGYVWRVLRRESLPLPRLLELCVGDTLDGSNGRGAFPRSKAELVAAPDGPAMFEIARQALVDIAEFLPEYARVARRPTKFCHGFGVFQYDLQHFASIRATSSSGVGPTFPHPRQSAGELTAAVERLGWSSRSALTDLESAAVAIAYNTGHYRPRRG